jgi:4-hydroxy-tetrahydrodipicolinate synthase
MTPMTDSRTAELRQALSTVVAIPVTPFAIGGDVDWPNYAALLKATVDSGISVVTPNGNTGEFYTLSPDEARRATEVAMESVGDRACVLVGVGLDTASAVAAARHARSWGAPMVMVHQPLHPYVSGDGWVDYHREIADAVPDVGVVLYLRDERIGGHRIAELGRACPNVVGVKYAVRDPARFGGVARDAGRERFAWLAGLAELSAPGYWALGARGFTSGLVNVAPRLALDLLDALRTGDSAEVLRLWDEIRPFEDLRAADSSADNVSVVKEALAQLGVCGREVRPPSRLLPEAVRHQVSAILLDWGLT